MRESCTVSSVYHLQFWATATQAGPRSVVRCCAERALCNTVYLVFTESSPFCSSKACAAGACRTAAVAYTHRAQVRVHSRVAVTCTCGAQAYEWSGRALVGWGAARCQQQCRPCDLTCRGWLSGLQYCWHCNVLVFSGVTELGCLAHEGGYHGLAELSGVVCVPGQVLPRCAARGTGERVTEVMLDSWLW